MEMGNVICLCGSTKFHKAYQEWNARLTLAGNIVISVGVLSHMLETPLTTEQKQRLDQLHLKKIDMSGEIFVLDVGGYIGNSTRNEIVYATAKEKKITYLSKAAPDWTENDCLYVK